MTGDADPMQQALDRAPRQHQAEFLPGRSRSDEREDLPASHDVRLVVASRIAGLAKWRHLQDGCGPHAGIAGVPPMSRLKPSSGKNVLTLHSSPRARTAWAVHP